MTQLYSRSQIRQIEHSAISHGIPAETLMRHAAQAAFSVITQHWPYTTSLVICVGKGNNGGDGLMLAQIAHQEGWHVAVYVVEPPENFAPLPKAAYEQLASTNVTVAPMADFQPSDGAVLVDALLGIGLKGEVSEPYRQAILAMNAADLPVLALDVPSGVHANTGGLDSATIKADVTLTFLAHKMGLFTGPALSVVGHVLLETLGVPADCYGVMSEAVACLDARLTKSLLPPREKSAHKGDYGHVLVIGGDYGMGGAVRMAAEAAMRIGAGLVTVATRPEHVNIVSGSRPELMCHQVESERDLSRLLTRASVVVLGPGLGQTEWAHELYQCVLDSDHPKVLDADALNILSATPTRREDWVLTPHPGEASRLLDQSPSAIGQDRYLAAKSLQSRYGGQIVLKGAGTILCNTEQALSLCLAGNPGMATGGMGDILSGIIGGLIAQGLSLSDAANVGVYTHATAADQAASEGGERGLLATDVLAQLRSIINPREH